MQASMVQLMPNCSNYMDTDHLNLVDEFIRNLLEFPPDPQVLQEAIYGSSQLLDGRRLAEEFLRRRKLADKGIAPEATTPGSFLSGGGESKGSGGGWSEVAKKVPASGAKEEASSAFKVVAAKKKSRR